jgi:hypothetical protein
VHLVSCSKSTSDFRAVDIATHNSSQKKKAINALSLLFKARTELGSTFDNISSYSDNDNRTMRMTSPSFRETNKSISSKIFNNIKLDLLLNGKDSLDEQLQVIKQAENFDEMKIAILRFKEIFDSLKVKSYRTKNYINRAILFCDSIIIESEALDIRSASSSS